MKKHSLHEDFWECYDRLPQAELIIFASHLLRIIDSRAPMSTTP